MNIDKMLGNVKETFVRVSKKSMESTDNELKTRLLDMKPNRGLYKNECRADQQWNGSDYMAARLGEDSS